MESRSFNTEGGGKASSNQPKTDETNAYTRRLDQMFSPNPESDLGSHPRNETAARPAPKGPKHEGLELRRNSSAPPERMGRKSAESSYTTVYQRLSSMGSMTQPYDFSVYWVEAYRSFLRTVDDPGWTVRVLPPLEAAAVAAAA
eukprot:CAMPEP_0206372872 /NCGR_PEP_ID=MMETSP0294-20121207/7372_1 /ASSEMBLY_ACC=CAM_ASM_000327 /TAXON_ID=39354 /ORGANISM="Heterosigma akashiwo, Strain CCMP2393" /LENGTH=143 /DNA_ID=CAMNT_0053820343 /DNA_START=64 /DNA_END=491 /DNA_ORIENTATION=+